MRRGREAAADEQWVSLCYLIIWKVSSSLEWSPMFNPQLYQVVRELYEEKLSGFAGENPNSEEFVASFPYWFFRDDNKVQERIAGSALTPEHRQEAEKAIEAYYSDSHGGNLEFYFSQLVEDFLNYVIPRSAGLPDGLTQFERLYEQLDSCIFGKLCHVTVFAVLENAYDHAGHGANLFPRGFRLGWYSKMPSAALHQPYARERAVPFYEIQKAARAIGRGRDIKDKHSYFVLEYSITIPKKRDSVGAAYRLRDDIASKFVFALRLVGLPAAYSDYRGFRMPGHLSAYSMNCINFPDEPLEREPPCDLDDRHYLYIGRLLPKLLHQPFAKVDLIDQKIEDAARRQRRVMLGEREAQLRTTIDKMLDYFQILEAVVPAEGSEYISLYGAVLLKRGGYRGAGMEPFEMFMLFKDMYKIRNAVMHGRIDDVMSGKASGKFRTDRQSLYTFKQMVHGLAALYVLNGPLRDAATKLALGNEMKLETLFADAPARKPGAPREPRRLPAMEPVYW
jgi:hypothetical protein